LKCAKVPGGVNHATLTGPGTTGHFRRCRVRPISRTPVKKLSRTFRHGALAELKWRKHRADSRAGVGIPDCRGTRALSGVTPVACTTRPGRDDLSIGP
jgi:hypothetical protein